MSDSSKVPPRDSGSDVHIRFPDFLAKKPSGNKAASNEMDSYADVMDTECNPEEQGTSRQEKILHVDFYDDFGDLFDGAEPWSVIELFQPYLL